MVVVMSRVILEILREGEGIPDGVYKYTRDVQQGSGKLQPQG